MASLLQLLLSTISLIVEPRSFLIASSLIYRFQAGVSGDPAKCVPPGRDAPGITSLPASPR
jgi:hypothetical protein